MKQKEDQKKLQKKDEAWRKRQAMETQLNDYIDHSTGTIMKIIRPILNWASFASEGSATWNEDQELTVNELLEMVASLNKASESGELLKSASAPATPNPTLATTTHRTVSDFSAKNGQRDFGHRSKLRCRLPRGQYHPDDSLDDEHAYTANQSQQR